MEIFSFDVTVSNHDLLHKRVIAGRYFGAEANHVRIVIADDDFLSASRTALQMVFAMGEYPTGIFVRL